MEKCISCSIFAAATIALMLVAACGNGGSPPPAAPRVSTAVAPPPSPMPSASAAPAEPPKGPVPAVRYTGLAAPDCVLYDEQNDRYLVSNVNGGQRDTDDNGFIAALSPDGAVTNLELIKGGKNGVRLDAPKGMAIAKGILYVADIRAVRMFDLATGAPKGDIAIKGSTYLNDVAAAPDGRIYVTDSGLKFRGKTPDPTGSDAVWVIDEGRAKPVAKVPSLHEPNGIAWASSSLVVVALGAAEVYRLDASGAKTDVTTLPKGALDGVVVLPGDVLLVSSGEAAAIYRGKLGGAFEIGLPGQTDAGDIGYDTKRGRVLVPRMSENAVEAHDLK